MVEGMVGVKTLKGTKQMGPALLPTPLSPTRGRLVLDVPPASRSFTLFKTRLASDVYAVRGRSSIPRPRARPFGMPEGKFRVWLRHRRSRRHPAAAFRQGSRLHSAGALLGRSARFPAKPRLRAYPVLDLKRSLSV